MEVAEEAIHQIENRLSRIEGAVDQMDKRISRVEGTVDQMDKRLSNVETEIREMRREMNAHVRWILGFIIASWLTIIASIWIKG